MAQACIFLATGYEEVEMLTVVDMLRRAKISIDMVSITDQKEVTSSHNVTITADKTLDEVDFDETEMLILPGGMPGAKHIDQSPEADQWIRAAAEQGAYLCAICAAPMILGKRGLLAGCRAVCYPGFETDLHGARVEDGAIAADDHRITACGMGAAQKFGAALVAAMKGEEAAHKVWTSILADRK